MTRVLTGAVLLPLVLVLLLRGPAWGLGVAVGAFAAVAAIELTRLHRARGRAAQPVLAALGAVGAVGAFWARPPDPLPVLAAVVLVAVTVGMLREREPGRAIDAAASTLMATVYVGLGLGFFLGLRLAPASDVDGRHLVLFCLVVVWTADSAAYYGGRAFGRRPLFRRVSPAKTWEGVLFAVLGGVGAALLLAWTLMSGLSFAHAVGLALALVVAAVLGDLVESVQKRASASKDSGGLLPGHGGFLDRADSLLLAGPVGYFYYLGFQPPL